jgi:N-acetyltransferase
MVSIGIDGKSNELWLHPFVPVGSFGSVRTSVYWTRARVLMKGNRSMMKIEPVTLQGSLARLGPLRLEHAAQLYEASRDPGLWTYKPVKPPRSLTEMEQLIASVLQSQQAGACLPFAILSLERGRAVGETRYHNFMLQDYGVEIGWTWLTPSVQRTGVNTECKYLLLRHAFEVLGAIRVQFRTHHLNITSQRALERLGAVKEGVLRNQLILPDGSYRHSVYYSIIQSIIQDEWPSVKARLENMMPRESIG